MAAASLIPAMEALLPAATIALLRRAGAAAAREGAALYLVGGSVRDLLLGRPVVDLDLAVEGDGPRIAEALASELGGRVSARSQFGTAKLVVGEQTLDVATARLETYDRPGALPTVRPGTLRDDLARRDFTVNAMAAHLGPETFGAIEDRLGGGADLAQRVLRPLHDGSFVDDATRILRAVRYEHRLGFRMDAPTEAMVRRDAPYLSTISGDRVRHEVERICQEARPEAALARARDLGVLSALLPGLDWPEETHRAVGRARDAGEGTAPLLFVALLASNARRGGGSGLRRPAGHAGAMAARRRAHRRPGADAGGAGGGGPAAQRGRAAAAGHGRAGGAGPALLALGRGAGAAGQLRHGASTRPAAPQRARPAGHGRAGGARDGPAAGGASGRRAGRRGAGKGRGGGLGAPSLGGR